MTEILFLVAFALGSVLTGLLVVPLWREDRARLDARVTELLHLLESRAAPAEFAAFVHAPDPEPIPEFWYSEDGLVSVPVEDED